MKSLQKTAIILLLGALAGAGVFEENQAARSRAENQSLRQRQSELARNIERLRGEQQALSRRLAVLPESSETGKNDRAELLKLRAETARLTADKRDATASEARSWLDKMNLLKQKLEQTPQARIPEFRFLKEQDWLDIAKHYDLYSDKEFRDAFSHLRSSAERTVAPLLKAAMKKYAEANPGTYATDMAQLIPFLETPLEDAILQRYVIRASDSVHNLNMGGDWIILTKAPVDPEFDMQMGIGENGLGCTSFDTSQYAELLAPALKAYQGAHQGKDPENTAQLGPYITTPEQQAAFQKALENASGH